MACAAILRARHTGLPTPDEKLGSSVNMCPESWEKAAEIAIRKGGPGVRWWHAWLTAQITVHQDPGSCPWSQLARRKLGKW